MITVAILINGQPIMTRSARNTGEKSCNGRHVYLVDDGSKVLHLRTKGAVALAKKLLDLLTDIDGTSKAAK